MQSPLHRGGTRRQSNVHAGSGMQAHHFWQCPVAQQVTAVVDTELARFANQQAGHHITLKATDICFEKHPAGVRPWLWLLVCMATIAAMEFGRRQMSRLQLGNSHHSSAAIISRAENSAVARMWDHLAKAAGGHKLPLKQVELMEASAISAI